MSTAPALSHSGPGNANANFSLTAMHPQPGTRTGYVGLTDAVRIVRRRVGIILLVMALALIGALILLANIQPVFTATTTVMVLPSEQGASQLVPTTAPSSTDDAAIQTKVELLQSRALVRRTAQSLRLAEDEEFAPPAEQTRLSSQLFDFVTPSVPVVRNPEEVEELNARAKREAVIDRLIAHLRIDRVARSNLISITASSTDPVKAARIANRLVDMYIHNQINEAADDQRQEIKALSARVADVRGYLQRAEQSAASYRRAHGLLSSQPESNGSIEASQLSGLNAQAMSESALEERKAAARLPGGGAVATSPMLIELRQQETILARRMAELTSFYGAGYPQVIQTGAELSAVRSRLAQENSRILAELRSQANAAQARSAAVSGAIGRIRNQSFGDGQAAGPLRALERNVEAINMQYASLLNQLNAKIGSPPDDTPDISLVSRAPVPDSPAYPLPSRVLTIALIAALAIGVLLAFIVDTMDTKLRTAEQVWRLLGVPTLAMIPQLHEDHGTAHMVVAGRPRSRFAEAMRNLLIELESSVADKGSRVVLITSPLEGEGKNTVAKSLAATAAVLGRQAVVVDFDLRRPDPAMNADSAAHKSAGVVAFLTKRALVDDLVAVADEGNFAVVGVGEAAADPGALIASPQLPRLISELRDRFEFVIINGPPILPVRDAKTLADHADATLLVLRWGRTSPEAAMAAMEIFGKSVTGAVLNSVDYEAHAGRRYGDAIHHIARSQSYYELDPRPANLRDQVQLWFRRVMGKASEVLRLT